MVIHTFRALAERDFRLYFFGQAVSLIGTWVQQVAMSWIVYRVTGSAFLLGVITFSGQIPILLFAPVGGLLADRLDRRMLLAAIQVVAMTVAAFLGYLSYTESFSTWALIIASVVLGTSSAIEMPTRQSFILHAIHDRANAGNAIALNSLAFNGARVVGPAVAGAVLALIGLGTYLVVQNNNSDTTADASPTRPVENAVGMSGTSTWVGIAPASAAMRPVKVL